MAQNTDLQERYSSAVLAKLRKVTVFKGLFNTRYEGNPTAGAVKIPVRDTETTVGDYSLTNGKALTVGSTSYKTLVTDNDRAINELIDGYVASAVPDNIKADRLDSAGYSMAKDIDNKLVACLLHKTSGSYDNATALDSTDALAYNTIYGAVVDAIQTAKGLGVDVNEMWLVIPTDKYGLLLKSPEFISASSLGDTVKQNGMVGRIAGVPVFETNNIASTEKVEFILGNKAFCHYVGEFSVPLAIKDLADGVHIGASALQGRWVDGCMVSRPTTVLVKNYA